MVERKRKTDCEKRQMYGDDERKIFFKKYVKDSIANNVI